MGKKLEKMFDAKSVAIVGASSDPIRIGGRPLKYLIDQGYTGKIYPINPKYNEIMDVTCYPDISAISDEIDLAIVALPADKVEKEIVKGIKMGIKSYIIFSSGYGETNSKKGMERQVRLQTYSQKHELLILGPNSLGFINSNNYLTGTFTTALESKRYQQGRLGFVSQSGALAAYFLDLLNKNNIGFSKWISTGNEVSLEAADFIEYLVNDVETKLIAVYLEDIKNGRKFKQAAVHAAKMNKPIIVIKAGSSEVGSKAAASHTGSITGEDSKYQALFEQLGIIRVRSLTDLIRLSKTFLFQGYPRSNQLGVVSVSGGAGVMLADEAADVNFQIPEFEESTVIQLREKLPSYASVQNPMDITGQVLSNRSMFMDALKVLREDLNISNIVIFIGLMKSIEKDLLQAVESVDFKGKQVSLVWIGASKHIVKQFEQINVPVYEDIPDVIKTMSQLYGSYKRKSEMLKDTRLSAHLGMNSNIEESQLSEEIQYLTEFETKSKLLTVANKYIPREKLVKNANDALQYVEQGLISFPLVLKIQSDQMLHKSDDGGLLLNICTEQQLTDGVNQLILRSEQLKINIEGILMQEMMQFDQELIISFQHDNQLGKTLVIGRGGIYVEVLKDVSTLYLPVSKSTIKLRLMNLKSSKLLTGYRGQKAVDLDKLATVIYELSEDFIKQEGVKEIEINPLAIDTETNNFWIIDGLAVVDQKNSFINDVATVEK